MFTIYFSQLKFELNLGPSFFCSSIQFSRSDALLFCLRTLSYDIIGSLFCQRSIFVLIEIASTPKGWISLVFPVRSFADRNRVYNTNRHVSTSNSAFTIHNSAFTILFWLGLIEKENAMVKIEYHCNKVCKRTDGAYPYHNQSLSCILIMKYGRPSVGNDEPHVSSI